MAQKKRIQRLEGIIGPHPGPNCDGQSLTGIFVQNGQHLVAVTIAELVVQKVPFRHLQADAGRVEDAPNVVRMGRPQPND